MAVRGEALRAAIRVVAQTFAQHADKLVFLGGCALGLYARLQGGALRATKDVDCISTFLPWVLQEKFLADLCQRGVLVPDKDLQCRYRIKAAGVDVDVLSPDGLNVGAVNPWFRRAAHRAGRYEVAPDCTVLAVTPPYFVATKLVALLDRGDDILASTDAEDLVTVAVELPSLADDIAREGIGSEVAALWSRVLSKFRMRTSDLPDFVEAHLHPDDREHAERVTRAIEALLSFKSEGASAEGRIREAGEETLGLRRPFDWWWPLGLGTDRPSENAVVWQLVAQPESALDVTASDIAEALVAEVIDGPGGRWPRPLLFGHSQAHPPDGYRWTSTYPDRDPNVIAGSEQLVATSHGAVAYQHARFELGGAGRHATVPMELLAADILRFLRFAGFYLRRVSPRSGRTAPNLEIRLGLALPSDAIATAIFGDVLQAEQPGRAATLRGGRVDSRALFPPASVDSAAIRLRTAGRLLEHVANAFELAPSPLAEPGALPVAAISMSSLEALVSRVGG